MYENYQDGLIPNEYTLYGEVWLLA